MQQQDFDTYLSERYNQQVNWYDVKAAHNKWWYIRLSLGLLVFSSITPVLIALSFWAASPVWWKFVPVTTSVIVAVLAGALKLFNFQDNWTTYRTTCETLRKEIHLYRAGIGEYSVADDRKALFVDRVESLVSRENTLWQSVRQCTGEAETGALKRP